MRFLPLAVVGALTSSVKRTHHECHYSLEILQIQDGSSSFRPEIENMRSFMVDLTTELGNEYGEFKFGLSSFVDKPIPIRGYGEYGNWASHVALDYCYREHTPLTTDNAKIIKGLHQLEHNLGSGNDFPENPMEALIFAAGDEKVGWSPTEVTHSGSGRPIVRILMLVTDDIPHFPTNADDAIARFWNYPRSYPSSANPMISTGGFGAHDFYTAMTGVGIVNVNATADLHDYVEMADLFAIFDHTDFLTATQATRLDALISKFGPFPFPEVIPHPGDTSIPDCTKTEYPTLQQVSKYLRDRKMHVIFLVTKPTAFARPVQDACRAINMIPASVECLEQLYTNYSNEMGINAVVASINGENTKARIMESIGTMTDLLCIAPETTEDASEPTTSAVASSAEQTTEDASEPRTSAVASSAEQTSPDAQAGTEAETAMSTVEGESSDIGVVIPDGGSDGGSPVGVITGAAAGGAAVIAAGLIYAKFATGLFGGSGEAAANAAQQVETSENPVERETVEEVTMDMFQ